MGEEWTLRCSWNQVWACQTEGQKMASSLREGIYPFRTLGKQGDSGSPGGLLPSLVLKLTQAKPWGALEFHTRKLFLAHLFPCLFGKPLFTTLDVATSDSYYSWELVPTSDPAHWCENHCILNSQIASTLHLLGPLPYEKIWKLCLFLGVL